MTQEPVREIPLHGGNVSTVSRVGNTVRRNAGLPFSHQALYAWRLRFAFQPPSGALDNLTGRTFEVRDVPFLDFFRSLPR